LSGNHSGGRGLEQDDVTTVVMTRDRRDELLRTVERTQGALVVVDNGSSDGTVEALRALERPGLTVVPLRRNVAAVARTIGARAARTPLVAFADDDSWWAPGSLEAAAATFDRYPRLGLLAGRVLVGTEERDDPFNDVLAGSPLGRPDDLPGPRLLGFIACAAVVRRDAYLATGGFDDVVGFVGEEERVALDLASAGWGLSYVEDAVVHHHPSPRRSSPAHRQAVVEHHALLTAVMRRPWDVVRRRHAQRTAPLPVPRRTAAQSFMKALRHRKRLPPHVEAWARQLDDRTSPAPLGDVAVT